MPITIPPAIAARNAQSLFLVGRTDRGEGGEKTRCNRGVDAGPSFGIVEEIAQAGCKTALQGKLDVFGIGKRIRKKKAHRWVTPRGWSVGSQWTLSREHFIDR